MVRVVDFSKGGAYLKKTLIDDVNRDGTLVLRSFDNNEIITDVKAH